jgi:hypothetical protein
MLAGLIPSVGTVGDWIMRWPRPRSACARPNTCGGIAVPERAAAYPSRSGGHHLRVGALVQREQGHAPTRPTPAGRSRGRVLRSTQGRATHRSHVTRCASNPVLQPLLQGRPESDGCGKARRRRRRCPAVRVRPQRVLGRGPHWVPCRGGRHRRLRALVFLTAEQLA